MQRKEVGQDTEEGEQLLRGREWRSLPVRNSNTQLQAAHGSLLPVAPNLMMEKAKHKQKQRRNLDSKPDGPTQNSPLQCT